MLVKPFDHIAGCSTGTWTDGESVIAILDFIQAIEDNPQYNETFPPMAQYWKEFAVDLVNDKADDLDTIDLDYWTDRLIEHCDVVLPAYCSFSWEDNELRVVPYIDDELTKVDELPCIDGEWEHANPDNEEYILLINDHGNATLFEWFDSHRGDSDQYQTWQEVWGMV